MSLINTEIKPFKATAYHNGKFVPVTHETSRANGPWWCSIPRISPSSARPNSATSPTTMPISRSWAWRSTAYPPTRISPTRPGTTPPTPSQKVQYPLVGDPTAALARNFGVLIEEEGLAYRGTFVIDPDGRIKIMESPRQRHRPRRQGAAAQGQGRAVRGLASRVRCARPSGLPAPHLVAVAGSGRQDLARTSKPRQAPGPRVTEDTMLDGNLKTQLEGYLARHLAAGGDRRIARTAARSRGRCSSCSNDIDPSRRFA